MSYDIIPWRTKNIKMKVLKESKWDSYLFLPLIGYKGLDKKWIIISKKKRREVVLSRLNNRYKLYIEMLKIQDNLNNMGINLYNENENHLLQNVYLDIIRDKNKVIGLFNEKLNNKDSHYLSRKYIKRNILEENFIDIKSRNISNKLLFPNYFFTGRFNEKSMISQIRFWTNSIYSFLKKDKSSIKHIDIYTSKLINLFFSVKNIKTRRIWNTTLFNVYKIVPHLIINKYINRMIKYTSSRSTWSLSQISHYPPILLTTSWIQNQIRYASILNKYIRSRKNTLFGLYKPKLQFYYRKRRRGWLSKPLFKHTSYNLIIDLFIFNNKKNNLRKFSNLLSRRALYKYMYSLYINYVNKVTETLDRPRFFYINLIEPRVYNYYSNIIKAYERLLIKNSKVNYLMICMLALRWNNVRKNYIQYIKNKTLFSKFKSINIYLNNLTKGKGKENNLIKINSDNETLLKKHLYYRNKKSKNLNREIKDKNKIKIEMYDLNKKLFTQKKYDKNQNKKKKIVKMKKPKYLKLRKYLLNLDTNSKTSLDLNKLTLWNRKGLEKDFIIEKKKKIPKAYRNNKYSLEEYKRKIYYAKGKTKRKIAPSLWKTKLMSFFLLSKKKKKDISININHINNKENELYKNIRSTPKIKHIFEKNINFNWPEKLFKNEKKNAKFKELNKKEEINSFKHKEISLFNSEIDKTKKNKYEKKYISPNNIIFNKKEYFKKDVNLKEGKSNILYGLSQKFYNLNYRKKICLSLVANKENILLYLNKKSISCLNNENIRLKVKKDTFKGVSCEDMNRRSNNNIKRKVYNKDKKSQNSKYLWDNLDYSVIKILSNLLNREKKDLLKFSSYNKLFNKINNNIINSNMLYLDVIKKEFYNINRDVVISKVKQEKPINTYTSLNIYRFTNNIHNDFVLNLSAHKNKKVNVNIWPLYIEDKDQLYIPNKEYNLNVFKPYYKYMLPLFIYEGYKSFISYLGFNNLIRKDETSYFSSFDWIKSNDLIILNFIIIKTLLDLLHYNYRSLIKIKSKYYYLNTIRYYGAKFRRLQFNTWIASVKYIKRLRKTPRHFWNRYDKLASSYYGRIIQSAELNTKRKIVLPFVLYFEDLLYIIYGKWVIVRLWPIKRYYLNSYILSERIMIMLVIRRNKWNAVKEFRRSARKLISIFRWFQIKKTYDYINEYNTRWPSSLINIMKDSKSKHYLNYNNLEFFNEKLEKDQMLSTYPIKRNYLKYYLSIVNNHYIETTYNYIENLSKLIITKRMFLKNEGKMKSQLYVRYWLKPLNTYIFTMKQGIDITGVKFRLGGRTGISASNARRFKKSYFFGNLIGARHYNKRTRKTTNLTNPVLRNTVKSNIDYAYNIGINRNGCITLKVWISSLFSSDIHELILYLTRIKYLYNQLINRHYLVHSKLANISNNWLLHYNNNNLINLNDQEVPYNSLEKLKLNKIRYDLNKRF